MSDSTRVPIVDGGVRYVAAPDDALADGVRVNALVRARLIDELTLAPIAGPVTVLPDGLAFATPRVRALVNPRAADGAIVGVVGTPVQVLPALRTASYEVGIAVSAGGYLATTSKQMLGPQGLFPGRFAAADLGDLALHRAPVTLFGRTMLRTAVTTAPLSVATVRVTGIWRTVPTPTTSPPASPPDLAAIDAPLYAARSAAVTTVTPVTLVPDAAHAKQLMRAGVAGSTTLHLSDRDALAAGDVLGVDEGDASRAEWVVVTSIAGSTAATEPAIATLAYPLARSHAAGALAHPVAATAPGVAHALALDAIAGDTTLLLTSVAGLAASAVEVAGGASAAEYHRLSLYETVSNADGDWRLPPLSRVAQVELTATHAAHPTLTRTVTAEYPRREQRVDHVFT